MIATTAPSFITGLATCKNLALENDLFGKREFGKWIRDEQLSAVARCRWPSDRRTPNKRRRTELFPQVLSQPHYAKDSNSKSTYTSLLLVDG